MGIGRILTWGIAALLIFVPFNWIRLWLIDELPASAHSPMTFLWAGGIWALGGGLVYFLIISGRGKKKSIRTQHNTSTEKIKWSGKDTGPFSITTLTPEQSSCLMNLVAGESVSKSAPRTINSLIKHRFIEENPSGHFTITDHGLNAYENLRWR